ncbi:hypothetical protein [Arenibacter sp. ARW7G5Y1]|uniref:hypothetical protein n=1 Tax=Arenibacter sp. ARW7G5Y1 TaxID=2135619 RepID=UPI000D76183E|nr:hypothetical protein [Arenibacter sp. ARW7G5Y1]PXX23712.1 hypothetical protein C7972_1185 [Arenibacter sp. ARW7G5Y1]
MLISYTRWFFKFLLYIFPPTGSDQDILKDEIMVLSSRKVVKTGISELRLQLVTFLGTSENAVKSQIHIAIITYFMLQVVVRTVTKKEHEFSNFVEKIRICLYFYLTLDYACNMVGEGAK